MDEASMQNMMLGHGASDAWLDDSQKNLPKATTCNFKHFQLNKTETKKTMQKEFYLLYLYLVGST